MDDQTVRTICYLSRLKLDDEKSKKILSDLDTIIEMIDSLSSSNTENISPLYNPLEETARKFNDKIKSAVAQAGRSVEEIKLIAVSKKKSTDLIAAAHHCGLTNFGENYLQESVEKISSINSKGNKGY